jgi:lipopolysaccharide/colanic/teichoic acid biosynthesis glycosyltransferase
MGLIVRILGYLLGVSGALFLAIAARLVASDIEASLPQLTERLIDRAVRRLPHEQRDRFAEEWRSHVNETPGGLRKLATACGFQAASRTIAAASRHGTVQPVQDAVRSMFNFIGSVCLLVFLSPVILLCVMLIKANRSGTVFDREERVGLNGKIFGLYKFRTMPLEKNLITSRVGAFLQHFRIDELPQVYNILRGDMGLIGPRPERPDIVANLGKAIPAYSARHSVKPGLTGWAQMNHPYGASLEDARTKLSYDLHYIKYRNLFFDMRILMTTVWVVLFGSAK